MKVILPSVAGDPGFQARFAREVEAARAVSGVCRAEGASDVFSLGAVLAFAATGEVPFGHRPSPTIGYRIVHTEPDLSAAPQGLHPLLVACLSKDPAQRPSPGRILELLESRISLHAESEEPWLPPKLRH